MNEDASSDVAPSGENPESQEENERSGDFDLRQMDRLVRSLVAVHERTEIPSLTRKQVDAAIELEFVNQKNRHQRWMALVNRIALISGIIVVCVFATLWAFLAYGQTEALSELIYSIIGLLGAAGIGGTAAYNLPRQSE